MTAWTNDPHVTDWYNGSTDVAWPTQGASAVFNSSTVTAVPLGDQSYQNDEIIVSSIQVTSYSYSFSSTYSSKLEIPSAGTTIESDSGATADFSAATIASQSTGGLTTTGFGGINIGNAALNSLTIGQTSTDAGTLAIAGGSTVTVTGAVNVNYATTLDVEGTLNLTANGGGATVSGAATLEGLNGVIDLPASNTPLVYQSSVWSTYDGTLAGIGPLDVYNGELSLGGENDGSYTGPILVQGKDGTQAILQVAPIFSTYYPYGTVPIPATTDLTVKAPGLFDLNGQVVSIGSLSGTGSASDSATTDAVITNTANGTSSSLTINCDSTLGHFGGRIIDGSYFNPSDTGTVNLSIFNGKVWLDSTQNYYSQGTDLNDATLTLGYDNADGMIIGNVAGGSGESLVFNNVNTETFAGSLANPPGESTAVEKEGTGTLDFDPTQPQGGQTFPYGSTEVAAGTMVFQSIYLPQYGGITVDPGATLTINNGGSVSEVATISNYGVIDVINGSLDVQAGAALTNESGARFTNSQTLTVEGSVTNDQLFWVSSSGTATISNGGALNNYGSLTLAYGSTTTDSGSLTNSGSLSLSGTYDNYGTTTGAGTITVSNSFGDLVNESTGSLTASGTFTVSDHLSNYGTMNTGAITIDGFFNNYGSESGGLITIGGTGFSGTLNSSGSVSNNIQINSGGNYTFNNNYNLIYSGVISGAGTVSINCSGHSVTFLNAETYTGTTYLNFRKKRGLRNLGNMGVSEVHIELLDVRPNGRDAPNSG